ncbi:MAG TPA: hypothetical protein VIP05_29840 [Burkholderiaceae bacterium]
MRINPFLAVAVVGGAVALVSLLWDENKPTGVRRARPRKPLTTLEQEMYLRLVEAFPGAIILAQVALTALIVTPRRDRSRYHHKVVDFAILDKRFEVQALVEVDDVSNASRHTVGEPVKELLELAGYPVFEYTQVPEVAELRRHLARIRAAKPSDAAPEPEGNT